MFRVLMTVLVAFSFSGLNAHAKDTGAKTGAPTKGYSVVQRTNASQPSILGDYRTDAENAKRYGLSRNLASGNVDQDLDHYRNLGRRLGIDLGLMIPMGSFTDVAGTSPMLGLHFVWEAIEPFSFTVNYRRASADNKTTPGNGKLSVNYISLGAQASFSQGRFVPFVKLEGGLYFNDLRDNANAITGDDALLTTVGASAGVGFDFIVGREVSIGFDAMYHFAVPRNVTRGGAGNFNLGSSFATVGFRLNF